ncbi:MAG: nicotinate phosphoribosyltransferase [Proteobacteria bacterium]|nr:nicotinate phosphoribosyltransferase [Pseudomonadota bacterium]
MKMKNLPLLADLYEFTMAYSYFEHRMQAPATFSLFIREYPPNRGYFVSAGLEDVLDFLESYHFEPQEIEYLDQTGLFSEDFFQFLLKLRFSGEVFAIPEGRIFSKDEPVLEITAPIIEAQLVESYVINTMNLQVSIATKASRCVCAAKGRSLVDFSLRRTQGTDAGLKAARASYLAGFSGTSNVLAGKLYGIPISGTMAHSFITSFEEEIDAFRAFARTFPENTVLLIDTYDTVAGAQKAAEVGRELMDRGKKLRGVRLDSGDMAALSKEVRKVLREGGLEGVSIFASGGIHEFKIARVIEEGAEIDAFGVGTKVGVSADAPYTDMAYKLVQCDGRPVLKLSTGKKTLVGEKQVFRTRRDHRLFRDTIALRDEKLEGEPLLIPVMEKGRRTGPAESLAAVRERFREEFAELDDSCKALQSPRIFPVELAPGLRGLQEKTVHQVREKELGES